jgi:hypothetical protein
MALFWLLLEAGVALALLLFIVWWTWPRRDAARADEASGGAPRKQDEGDRSRGSP